MHGIIAPVFTPFHENGDINLDPIPKYAKYLVKNSIEGILVGGTTGEFVSLSVEEKKSVVDAWLKEAKSLNLKVMVHVGGAPLPYVIEMAKYAERVKVDAIMTLPELYFKPQSPEQLVSYLEVVAKAAPSLPIYYYNFPMMSGVNVNNATFFKLATSRIPYFMGMKADLHVANQVANQLVDGRKVFIANHATYVAKGIFQDCELAAKFSLRPPRPAGAPEEGPRSGPKHVGFSDKLYILAPSVLMGHDSSIATVTNMFPKLVKDIVKTTKAGDVDKARALQFQLNDLVDSIAREGAFVPAMKIAMECITGIEVGPPRMPQMPLSNDRRTKIQEKMRELGYSRDN